MAIVAATIVLTGPLAAQQTNAPAQQNKSQKCGAAQRPGSANVTPSRRDEPAARRPPRAHPPSRANSFTEGQAKDHILKAGYGNVKNLQMDGRGIWRGKAHKSGRKVNVSLDYRGNVVQQ